MKRLTLLFLVSVVTLACGGQARDDGVQPTTGPITIHLRALTGEAAPGVELAIHDPDGETTGTAVTDEHGSATFEVEEGGAVSWLRPQGLQTIFGLEPGQDLTVPDLPEPGMERREAGQIVVTIPSGFPGAFEYFIHDGCTGQPWSFAGYPSTVTIGYHAGCRGPDGTVTVVVIARDRDQPVAYATASVPVPPSSATPQPAEIGPWKTDLIDLDVRVTGVPQLGGPPHAFLSLRRAGSTFDYPNYGVDGQYTGTSTASSFSIRKRVPAGTFDDVVVDVFLTSGARSIATTSRVVGAARLEGPSMTMDLAGTSVPGSVDGLHLAGDDGVGWSSGSGAPGALALGHVWLHGKVWRFAAPRDPALRNVPRLPPSMAAAWLAIGEDRSAARVTLVTPGGDGSYGEALRALASFGLAADPLPGAGTAIRSSSSILFAQP